MAEGIINLFSALNTDTISNCNKNAEVATVETTTKTTESATTNFATTSTTTNTSTSKSISMKLGIDDKNYDDDNCNNSKNINNNNYKSMVEDENDDFIDYHEIMKEEYEHNDTRIAMIGNVDSGKSTLIGVLTNSLLDDGRGCARSLVLKHRHEQDNGRTSAVTVEIMGYKGDEQVISNARNHNHRWMEIMENSEKTVSYCFFNLAVSAAYDNDYYDSDDDVRDDNRIINIITPLSIIYALLYINLSTLYYTLDKSY